MSTFAALYLDEKTVALIRKDVIGESFYPALFDIVGCAIN